MMIASISVNQDSRKNLKWQVIPHTCNQNVTQGDSVLETCIYCLKLTKFSLLNTHFVFLDTEDYLADNLFIKHRARVYFGNEFVNKDNRYRVIFCYVRKWDEQRFHAAMEELPNKMLLFGNADYLNFCLDTWGEMVKSREGEMNSYDSDTAAEQAE